MAGPARSLTLPFVQTRGERKETVANDNALELAEVTPARTPSPSILKTIKTFTFMRSPSLKYGVPDPDDAPDEPSLESGYEWVRGVVMCAMGTSVVGAINVILAIAAVALSYSKFGGSSAGSRLLYEGSCSQSKGWATGLHLLINILSTLLLAASNYCMQCLSAPSRADVDRAHSNRRWLEIGTAGLRNLWYVNWRRRVLWFILLISSLPIHLVYNSVVFSKLTTYAYPVLIASPGLEFRDQPMGNSSQISTARCFADYMNQTVSEFGVDLADDSKFEALTKEECVDRYAVNYVTDRKAVVVLVNDNEDNFTASENPALLWGGAGDEGLSYHWICAGVSRVVGPGADICTKDRILGSLDNWIVQGEPFSEKVWSFDVPTSEGTLEVKAESYDVHANYTPKGEPKEFGYDMHTLLYWAVRYNPTEEQLRDYLNNETTWDNGAWAASVNYTVDREKCNVFPALPATPVALNKYSVDGCLSQRAVEKCRLMFSLPISLTVIGCNIVKVVCMFLAAKENRHDVFLNVGDAVASYLRRPDPNTAGRCLLSKRAVKMRCGLGGSSSWSKPVSQEARFVRRTRYDRISSPSESQKAPDSVPDDRGAPVKFEPARSRWYQATSKRRWLIVLLFATMALILTGVLFSIGKEILHVNGLPNDVGSLWRMGFGTTDRNTFIDLPEHITSTIETILLVNTPQLGLSMIYFAYNHILTAMVLSAEYASYGIRRKPLRVSWPRGEQRSTYYLSLPYKYSIPLMSILALLHWLLSQSIFYVRIDIEGYHGAATGNMINTCGYSPIALLCTIIVGSVMTLGLVCVGMRKYDSPVPLAANCSAAISAACHAPAIDRRAAYKPLMWGEVDGAHASDGSTDGREGQGEALMGGSKNPFDRDSSLERVIPTATTYDAGHEVMGRTEYGHCCFTSIEVVKPVPGKMYM